MTADELDSCFAEQHDQPGHHAAVLGQGQKAEILLIDYFEVVVYCLTT